MDKIAHEIFIKQELIHKMPQLYEKVYICIISLIFVFNFHIKFARRVLLFS